MVWPVEKRLPYAAIRERMTSAEGKRMRCIRGAYAAHRSMHAEGRTPGEEGRAVIQENRKRRKEEKRQAKIAALSSVTTGEKGRDGLTQQQRQANELLKKHWAEMEAARVERNRNEWLDKQKRLESPVSERRTWITDSMRYPY
jgi:hypothetical protein